MGRMINSIGLENVGLPKSVVDKINSKFGYEKYRSIKTESKLKDILVNELNLPTKNRLIQKSASNPKSMIEFRDDFTVYPSDWVYELFGGIRYKSYKDNRGYDYNFIIPRPFNQSWEYDDDNKTKGFHNLTYHDSRTIISSIFAADLREFSYFEIIWKFTSGNSQSYGGDKYERPFYVIFVYSDIRYSAFAALKYTQNGEFYRVLSPVIALSEERQILSTDQNEIITYSTKIKIPENMFNSHSRFFLETKHYFDTYRILDIRLV